MQSLGIGLLSVSEHRFRSNRCPLRHNSQCQVLASAAFVVGSEVGAVAGEGGPISKVTEPAENRDGRGVSNNGENCADCERGSAVIDKRERHVAVSSYAEGGNFRRFGRGTVQRAFISRERPKR